MGPLEVAVTGKLTGLSGTPEVALVVDEQVLPLERVAAYLVETGMAVEGMTLRGEGRIAARVSGRWDTEGCTYSWDSSPWQE